MAFTTKEWKDRLVEFAGRRKLKNVTTGAETVFDVSRSEGAVSQAGDAFSAANMNNLEQRIKNEFDTVNGSLNGKASKSSDLGNCTFYQSGSDFYVRGADSVTKKLGSTLGLLNYVHSNLRGDYAPTIFTLKAETQVAVIMASSSDTEPVLNISGAYTFVHGITSVRSNDGRDPGNLPWTKFCVIKRISAGSITIYGGGNGYWWGGQFAFAEFG